MNKIECPHCDGIGHFIDYNICPTCRGRASVDDYQSVYAWMVYQIDVLNIDFSIARENASFALDRMGLLYAEADEALTLDYDNGIQ